MRSERRSQQGSSSPNVSGVEWAATDRSATGPKEVEHVSPDDATRLCADHGGARGGCRCDEGRQSTAGTFHAGAQRQRSSPGRRRGVAQPASGDALPPARAPAS